MYSRSIKFIEKQNVLYDKQFGFRSHHSTEHAILSIVVKIQKAIEENNFSTGPFLGFKKTFDTVNHEILIEKTRILRNKRRRQKMVYFLFNRQKTIYFHC